MDSGFSVSAATDKGASIPLKMPIEKTNPLRIREVCPDIT
jgi:hypothetical protein